MGDAWPCHRLMFPAVCSALQALELERGRPWCQSRTQTSDQRQGRGAPFFAAGFEPLERVSPYLTNTRLQIGIKTFQQHESLRPIIGKGASCASDHGANECSKGDASFCTSVQHVWRAVPVCRPNVRFTVRRVPLLDF